ncbi:MAG: hypothetical protein SFV22_06310 [Saprospiraceae bacterium]|nr:hypothetical protein [Saprospiraceae bacterium]
MKYIKFLPASLSAGRHLALFFAYAFFLLHSFKSNGQCFAGINAAGCSSDIATDSIVPFCSADGFTVTASVWHQDFCNNSGVDLYVIVEANIHSGSFFTGAIVTPVTRYFSNIVSNPTAGTPTLTQVHTLSSNGKDAILFRYRVFPPAAPFGDTTQYTLPFKFGTNFFFGDVPWNVWVSAKEPDGAGCAATATHAAF